MRIEFSIEGEKQLSRRLIGVTDELHDFGAEFKKTGEYLTSFFKGEVFESRGSAFGEEWRPLSRRYAAWKSRYFPGKGILERTGRMRKSFGFEADTMAVRVFNTADYFKYHQSRMPRTRIPRRIMMKLDEKRKQAIVKIIHQGIESGIRKHFKDGVL